MKSVTSMLFCGIETSKTPFLADTETGTVSSVHFLADATARRVETTIADFILSSKTDGDERRKRSEEGQR